MLQGAFSEVTGPVVPELVAQTHTNYEIIAQAVSMRGAGHALGAIAGENIYVMFNFVKYMLNSNML